MTILSDLRMWEATTMNLDHKRVQSQAADEIERLRNLLDIAYDHLQGAGYKKDGPTLTKIEAGCKMSVTKP
ncbi:MAG: hypothetical protein WC710_13485 [Gallionella sp.]|jgi:hypothetical protein